jgi:hypothetical protein
LRADRRLLDAVGDVAHRRHDPAVPGDEIKKFKMMDVHNSGSSGVAATFNHPPPGSKPENLSGLGSFSFWHDGTGAAIP